MGGQFELVSEVAELARLQRALGRSMFSVTLKLDPIYMSSSGAKEQEDLADVIQQVERHGWMLEQTSAFSKLDVGEMVLLVFRAQAMSHPSA